MTMDASHLDDDALSASLDDALEDAAGQTHLTGCATCSARREQLAAARSALAGAPVEPVDELTRRRLLAAALAEAGPALAPRRPWYQRPALAGGVAAALLALFASVPFVTGRDSSSNEEAATASLEAAASQFLGDLGDLSDPAVLRERFGAQRSLALLDEAHAKTATGGANAGSGSVAEAPEALSSPSPLSPVAGRPSSAPPAAPAPGPAADTAAQRYGNGESDAGGLDRTVADACARTLGDGPARGSVLRAVATGTYQGTPAVVAVFEGERGTTAYVASRDGCRLLTRYQV